ncbi:MAG: potassium-transporting ATPase subunit KdpB [Alphaproteobacteria bacterium]
MIPNRDFSWLDRKVLGTALLVALKKLNPVILISNPMTFVVEIVAVLTTVLFIEGIINNSPEMALEGQVAAWLWFTVLSANFAEAIAERFGKARADALRASQLETSVKRLTSHHGNVFETVSSGELMTDDIILVEASEIIPADGEVIDGIAAVDESAITGESAPVIRESGGDRSGVTGGTKVVSDWLKVRVTVRHGKSFLDRMIAMVEGTKRKKTPNEVALTILLVGLSAIFLIVTVTLQPFAMYAQQSINPAYLAALLITLMPTTIGGLLSAIAIAGMDRLVKANIVAKSGRAVEICGDVDTLLLDKTGTITFGNRMANEFKPLPGVNMREFVEATVLASLSDETPEGKSIVDLGRKKYNINPNASSIQHSIPFSAETRISGADLVSDCEVRKGAEDAILTYCGLPESAELKRIVQDIARSGGTPIVVAKNQQILGVIHLKDIIKPGIRERFAELRKMGIRTVMITGDNPLTAAAIAAEAGVDDFLAEASPERKLELIRKLQAEGRLIAMCGDGSNDAPALAQADVGVAMNDGTQAAKEAANLIDLDSDPTKLLEVVRVGKELLMSRGALTTFSITTDVAKYFAILPPMFAVVYPGLSALNLMGLHSAPSAVLSAVIFNALIIVALIPLALTGVSYKPMSVDELLRRNLLIYGLGGIVAPFLAIKAIDMLIVSIGLI